MIVRIYNPTGTDINGKIRLYQSVNQARLVNLNEEPVEDDDLVIENNLIKVSVRAKKIVTVEFD